MGESEGGHDVEGGVLFVGASEDGVKGVGKIVRAGTIEKGSSSSSDQEDKSVTYDGEGGGRED